MLLYTVSRGHRGERQYQEELQDPLAILNEELDAAKG